MFYTKDDIVVRIGEDSSYDHYAELTYNKDIESVNAPKITKHEKPRGEFGDAVYAYSCTEMEMLDELDENEASKYKNWIDREIKNIGEGIAVNSDPFKILKLTKELVNYAKEKKLAFDFVQAKNVMKRGSTFIHIDPFGSSQSHKTKTIKSTFI